MVNLLMCSKLLTPSFKDEQLYTPFTNLPVVHFINSMQAKLIYVINKNNLSPKRPTLVSKKKKFQAKTLVWEDGSKILPALRFD